ncbi:NAD-dependent epimerase/dehydratase family protein [Phytohabitans sp. LJ34]|uniref:NAD-dependent epimerase/dehydratase family protein n=1 Tax=Phytohabitans sp. LJ34 TaxID=3452217 RepID=UPI003F88FFDC
MRVVVFGATGMLGQGVLRECLLAPDVESVVTVGRTPTGVTHEKLRDVVHKDLLDLSPIAGELAGLDACFFCLGVSSTGMSEADYRRITYDVTMAAARVLAADSPDLTFVYVSGAGTDGKAMWARVKKQTEDALLELFPKAYMFRPGFIQAKYGATSRTRLYRVVYRFVAPIAPLLRRLFPHQITTTELIGLAMLNTARHGAPKRVLDPRDINSLA